MTKNKMDEASSQTYEDKQPVKDENPAAEEAEAPADFKLSETWAQDGKQELLDWIEEQGIYIRE